MTAQPTAPAAGQPAPLGEEFAHLGETLYTVVGFYDPTGQRFAEQVWAESARLAEDLIQADYGKQVVNGAHAQLYICGVLEVVNGAIVAADQYAFFVDPDAPAPE